MNLSTVVVCSFYTADSYYRDHADSLRRSLDRLGLQYELQEIAKQPGEEWPDICRKKVPFLAGVCDRHPDKKVYWMDVDCQLLEFPPLLRDFSADIIGFQRGFGSPLSIGYSSRTRFWEPCFLGINTTPGARKFIRDAQQLEADRDIRATDDYFFEESWRANADRLSFQIIPSVAVLAKSTETIDEIPVIFNFGASGQVAEFKSSVVQHDSLSTAGSPAVPVRQRARAATLRTAKGIHGRLPTAAAERLRSLADRTGATHLLTGGGADALLTGPSALSVEGSPARRKLVERMIKAAQQGELAEMNDAFNRLRASGDPSEGESRAKNASDTFAYYATRGGSDSGRRLSVSWWPRPLPGNFGDWLSPLILSETSNRPIRYVSPTAKSTDPHIVGLGSIGRFVKPNSIVVGTGISSTDFALAKNATYISVRGPITAELLERSGGPRIESLGDPGALLSRIVPMGPREPNGRLALVRHFSHARLPLAIPEGMDELDILMSHPQAIHRFLTQLHTYDGVVTSAMHVLIACHSYGIPCALVTFEGFESTVAGSGIKYEDYSLGAGLETIHRPTPVPIDLSSGNLRELLLADKISEEKLDEIERAVHDGIATYLQTSA